MTLKKEGVRLQDNFRIFETNQFLTDLEQDFSGQQERIKKKLTVHVYSQLRQNPFFGKNIKKMVNYKPDTWRYRIGNYRFFYTIDDYEKTVFMISADNRQDAY
ncbi:MAG: type II toxin-antitoxin system RelE/ParE family toxin [Candidatus Omnitrophota bacterium]